MPFLEAGEGFIDVLFLLLTFFIIQNVWQIYLAHLHSSFVYARKLDFIKAPVEGKSELTPDEKFVETIIGKEFVQLNKGGIISEDTYIYEKAFDKSGIAPEFAVFKATKRAFSEIIAKTGFDPKDILVRLYFERDATVTYTVGVYDALNKLGFKTVQWGLESKERRL